MAQNRTTGSLSGKVFFMGPRANTNGINGDYTFKDNESRPGPALLNSAQSSKTPLKMQPLLP